MNLNSVLFPAPKCSYSIESLKGKLIWIPKYKKNIETLSTTSNSFVNIKNRSNSMISYDTPMLKTRQSVTVTNPNQKLKSKDLGYEEGSSILSTSNSKQQLPLATTQNSSNNQKLINEKSKNHRKVPSFKPNLGENLRIKTQPETENDDSFTFDDLTEQTSLNNTERSKYPQIPRNTIRIVPTKQLKYNLCLQTQLRDISTANLNECDRSQTSFDHKQTDEYGFSQLQKQYQQQQQSTPRTMFKYLTKNFSNPILKTKQASAIITESLMQTLPSSRSKKTFCGNISLHSLTLEQKIFQSLETQQDQKGLLVAPKQQGTRNVNENSNIQSSEEVEYCIPCLLLVPAVSSDKMLIYFHGNGEDINLAFDLLSYLRNNLAINVLAMEYPGYGLYLGSPNEKTILQDAEAVYEYLTDKLKLKSKSILLFGRSIGTGPATYLASRKEVGALILMSAFTSIRAAVKDFVGKWAQYLIKERFNNLEAIPKVKCPTFFIHGQRDSLIPYNHSEDLHNVCGGASELILPKDMDHIEFDFYEDFTYPLMCFLQRCGVLVEDKNAKKISFPKTVFNPPPESLNAYQQTIDPPKKRDHIRINKSYNQRINTDAGILSPRVAKRSLIEY